MSERGKSRLNLTQNYDETVVRWLSPAVLQSCSVEGGREGGQSVRDRAGQHTAGQDDRGGGGAAQPVPAHPRPPPVLQPLPGPAVLLVSLCETPPGLQRSVPPPSTLPPHLARQGRPLSSTSPGAAKQQEEKAGLAKIILLPGLLLFVET